ncbi:hypothetical protein QUF63_08630 [Anaerolineales bacterium HSG25]|nr:hypothetical protein [Anaerolineales bacterium HSG25]
MTIKQISIIMLSFMLIVHIAGCSSSAQPEPTSPPTQSESEPLPTPTNEPMPTNTPEPTATPVPPTDTPEPPPTNTPEPEPTAIQISDEQAQAEISALMMAEIPVLPTPESEDGYVMGIEGVIVTPLTTAEGQPPLWAANTFGFINFELEQAHQVSIYSHDGETWQMLARTELENLPTMLGEETMTQLVVPSDDIWLAIDSFTGAHSGCFDVLRFDGQTLHTEHTMCSGNPSAGFITDLNENGLPEILLNFSDYYVFCYACGVVYAQYDVLRWQNDTYESAGFELLDETADPTVRELNNQAVTYAEADLWQDAQVTIQEALTLDGKNDTIIWNNTLIQFYVDDYSHYEEYTGFPVLTYIFAGKYDEALEQLHPYTPEEIFNLEGPLIVDSPAVGWEEYLSEWLVTITTPAIEAKPDLAPAYFLRAWGTYLVEPTNPAIIEDIQSAAELNPDEPLYQESLIHFYQ